MKRPLAFKFVAAWCCLAMMVQASYLTRTVRAYREAGEAVTSLLGILEILALGFVVWQTVGLVQLKPFHRWFAVVFCAWWAIALVWNAAVRLPRPEVKRFPAITFFSILIALNLVSVWYLSRRRFREFAVQFVAERTRPKHSPLMQKVSEKRILQDIQSMKKD